MEFQALQSLALKVGEARTADDVLKCIVDGLAAQEGVALAHVWLILPGDICQSCIVRDKCPDQTRCLHLVASARKPIAVAEDDWSRLVGYLQRVPLNVWKVGEIGASGEPILITTISRSAQQPVGGLLKQSPLSQPLPASSGLCTAGGREDSAMSLTARFWQPRPNRSSEYVNLTAPLSSSQR